LYLAVSIARLALGLSLNVVMVVWLRWGVMGVVYANALSSCATVLALAAFTFPRTGISVSRRILVGMYRFGLPFIPASMAMLVLHNGDRYILNRFRPLTEVGIYSVGYKLGMIITYAITVPFANVWSTRMYTVVREPGGIETYAKVNTYYTFVQLLCWVALASGAPEVVRIAASRDFAAASSVIPVIAGAYVLREVAECWKNAFLIEKKTAVVGWMQPVIAAVNVALTWVLVQRSGIMGAAWATLLTFLLLLVPTVVLAERVMPTGVSVRRIGMAVVCAGCLFGAARLLPPMPLVAAASAKLVITACFPVLLVVLRIIPSSDRTTLIGSMMRLRAHLMRTSAAQSQIPVTRTSMKP
jgi:O-antigen/teichoic acid export membrane protein